jgi:hypothetical protein
LRYEKTKKEIKKMGQYWVLVNLDKKEFVSANKLGCGLKLWEQLANHPNTGSALIVLCAAMPQARGGGDFDLEENWHGKERTDNLAGNNMPENYPDVARYTIGRWAGDRIAFVGDYAEDSDLPRQFHASEIWEKCSATTEQVYTKEPVEDADMNIQDMTEGEHYGEYYHFEETAPPEYTDISEDVCRVIEHELQGKFTGSGWRTFVPDSETTMPDTTVG